MTNEWRCNVVANANGCLLWQGRVDANGYARWGGQWAHRRVFVAEGGVIPDRHDLDHTCEVLTCVNPEHLEPVTRAEHIARTMRRAGKDDLHVGAAYLRSLGMTFADIADALALAGRSSAAQAVRSAVTKGLVDPTEVPLVDRLTDQDRVDIRALRSVGVPVNDIAAWYGIHASHASRVSRGIGSGHAA